MKKIICVLLTVTLLFTSAETAFAKKNNAGKHNKHNTTQQQGKNREDKKQDFKIKASPVINYGNYKLPIMPITKGMDATVTFDDTTGVLKVVKNTITIVINFQNETVMVNGIADKNPGIFTAKKNNKMTVLIKYIAYILGFRVSYDDDEVTVEVPILDLPTNITISPVGTTVITNTLNNTSLYMTATAKITANQAAGGRAELYVGSKLVATDTAIASADTSVTFTTADSTPTNVELQSIVPLGGVVTVKLYNASNTVVTSKVANPTLFVDYISPTITGVTSSVYNVTGNQLYLFVTGASSIGDIVDVTKISLYDSTLGRTYQLTNTAGTGSTGIVGSTISLVINIGSFDKLVMTGFGTTNTFLTVSLGPLLKDTAGNYSSGFTGTLTIPVTVIN
ncbi:MAG: stalk domain-containing protein [Mobilitalea sp.]